MKKLCLIILGMTLLSFISLASVSALSIEVHVPKKSTDVIAGERFYFEIKIESPENTQRKDLELEYEITTSEGILVAQYKTLNVVETQASFIEFIVIPKSADSGLYIIEVNVKDSKGLSEGASANFQVTKVNQIKTYIFILLGVIVAGILIIWLILWLIHRARKRKIK